LCMGPLWYALFTTGLRRVNVSDRMNSRDLLDRRQWHYWWDTLCALPWEALRTHGSPIFSCNFSVKSSELSSNLSGAQDMDNIYLMAEPYVDHSAVFYSL
jgi:hypothetical protein